MYDKQYKDGKIMIGYKYRDGNWSDLYEIGKTMITTYPREDLILDVRYDAEKDRTIIKFKKETMRFPK